MKAKISALNKNFLVEFKDESEFTSFVTQYNDKINNIELIEEGATIPELQKSVEVAKPSVSDGWKTLEKSAIVQKEKNVEKKGMQLGGKYSEFKYEGDKTLDASTDSKVSEPKDDSPALKGEEPKAPHGEMSKEEHEEFHKEHPEHEDHKPHGEMSKEEHEKFHAEHPEHEDKKEESEDKEEKKEVDESFDSELNEVMEAAGVESEDSLADAKDWVLHSVVTLQNAKGELGEISQRDVFAKELAAMASKAWGVSEEEIFNELAKTNFKVN